MSVADKLLTIAENEQKVYEAGKLAVIKDSEYLSANEIGSIISAKDVSPVEHSLGVKLKSRNIFDADTILPSLENPSYAYAQAHWTKQPDGSFHLFNVAILAGYKWFENTSGYEGQMAISITGKVAAPVENQNGMAISFVYTDNTIDTMKMPCSEEYVTSTLVSNPNKTVAYISQSYSTIAGPYIKDIMIAYGTDTTYTPYMTDFEGVEVTRCGKNLFDKDKASVYSNWVIENGGFYLFKVFIGKGNTFTVSYQQDLVTGMDCPYTQIICNLSNIDKDSKYFYHKTVSGLINKKWTYTAIEDYIYIRSNVHGESALANFMQYIGNDLQVEIGETATEYEPYKEPQTATAITDGTVEGLTSLSPNMTLYTDNNGVSIECKYYRDIDTYINNLTTNIALTGGV